MAIGPTPLRPVGRPPGASRQDPGKIQALFQPSAALERVKKKLDVGLLDRRISHHWHHVVSLPRRAPAAGGGEPPEMMVQLVVG